MDEHEKIMRLPLWKQIKIARERMNQFYCETIDEKDLEFFRIKIRSIIHINFNTSYILIYNICNLCLFNFKFDDNQKKLFIYLQILDIYMNISMSNWNKINARPHCDDYHNDDHGIIRGDCIDCKISNCRAHCCACYKLDFESKKCECSICRSRRPGQYCGLDTLYK